MRIRSVNSMVLRAPTDELVRDSTHELEAVEVVAVLLETEEESTGLGLTYTVDVGASAIKALIDQDLAPLLVGRNPLDTEGIFHDLWWRSHSVGRRGLVVEALSAIDIALWDLKGKALGHPVRDLFGSCRERVPLYNSQDGWLSLPPAIVAERTRRHVSEMGMLGTKIKLGSPSWQEDLERVRMVREAIGPDVKLMVDANQGWRLEQALEMTKRLEEFEIEWVEEPLPADDLMGHVKLRQEGARVAAGETLYSVWDFYEYIREGAVLFVQPDIGRVGGVTHWIKVAHLAEAAHLSIAPHFMMEYHVQMLMCTPRGSWLEYTPWLQKLFATPMKIRDGYAYPPDEPGMGVELSQQSVEKYRVL